MGPTEIAKVVGCKRGNVYKTLKASRIELSQFKDRCSTAGLACSRSCAIRTWRFLLAANEMPHPHPMTIPVPGAPATLRRQEKNNKLAAAMCH